MDDVLVDHEAVEDAAVLERTSRHLLDTGVAFDVDFDTVVGVLDVDGAHGLESHPRKEADPAPTELGAEGGRNQALEHGIVLDVHGKGYVLGVLDTSIQSSVQTPDDDSGVHVDLDELLTQGKNLTSYRT